MSVNWIKVLIKLKSEKEKKTAQQSKKRIVFNFVSLASSVEEM